MNKSSLAKRLFSFKHEIDFRLGKCMKRLNFGIVSAIAITLSAFGASNAVIADETKPTQTQEMALEDKYLWLEEVEGEKAINWVKSQNERSLAHLQSNPIYKKLEADALAIVQSKERLTFGGYFGGYVSNFWQDDKQIRGVWRRSDFASWSKGKPKWETILDMDALSKAEGKNWVYKGAECLDDNNLWNTNCMLSLSNGGKDANEKREFNVKTRKFVKNGFVIPEAKSDITWLDINNMLVSTDWGEGSLTESGYPFIVKMHARGKDLKDAKEVFRGEKTDVSAGAYRIDDGKKHHYFFYRSPTFFTSITYLMNDAGKAQKLDLPSKHSIVGIRDGDLFFSIQEDWTPRGGEKLYMAGTLLRAKLAAVSAQSGVIEAVPIFVPQEREALQGASFTKDGLYVEISKNVKSEIRFYSKAAKYVGFKAIDLPKNGVAGIANSSIRTDEAFFSYNDLITPPSILMINKAGQKPKTVQSQPAKFDASNLVVEQKEVSSKDGTKIPFFVVHKKGIKHDGSTPTLLYGYGGFEVSMTPNYSPYIGKLWLERGGAYILANIRGGGEFGPEWHGAGLKTKRQVVYDDFIAIAEWAIDHKLADKNHLGIMGGSNGGLLMGVMLTQRPELFNAAVVQVPLLDMLRYHKLLAGASWIDEYGNPDIPEERVWLEKLTPYQNLKKRDDFPVPLIVTSTKDDRVHPGHARKYAAKLQELGMPFWYYENIDGGHSAAANLVEGAKRRALEYTYLTEKLMENK